MYLKSNVPPGALLYSLNKSSAPVVARLAGGFECAALHFAYDATCGRNVQGKSNAGAWESSTNGW